MIAQTYLILKQGKLILLFLMFFVTNLTVVIQVHKFLVSIVNFSNEKSTVFPNSRNNTQKTSDKFVNPWLNLALHPFFNKA